MSNRFAFSRIVRALRIGHFSLVASLFVAALFFCGCAEQPLVTKPETESLQAPPSEGLIPPGTVDFTLPDIDGRPFTLSALRGHPVIIEVWATWCAPCREEIPELNHLYRKYREQGLVVIGLSIDAVHGNGLQAVLPFMQKFHIKYPVLLADRQVIDQLAIDGAPITFFISPQGKVLSRVDGVNEPGELTDGTLALLQLTSS